MKPAGYLINSTEALKGDPGVFYDYILAREGLYIRAKNALLSATVCIAPEEVRGLASLGESVELVHGKIPIYLLDLVLSAMCSKTYVEQYFAIIWDGGYTLRMPTLSQGAGSVRYEVLPNTIMDLHSHTFGKSPHFSDIDDRDEQGFRLYAVVSGLRDLFPTVAIRLGIYGYFVPVGKGEIFV